MANSAFHLAFCATALLVSLWAAQPVSATTTKCGISHGSSTRIVGGRQATPHAYPWIVYIQSEYTPTQEGLPNLFAACEGSLIDDQWIVTASHCFGPMPKYQIHRVALVLGAHNLANKTEQHFVISPKKILRNGQYHDEVIGSKYDITMVQLPHKIDFAKVQGLIAPICLPAEGHAVSKSECSAIGWGKTGPGKDDPSSPILKVVDHNMMSAEECHRLRPEVQDVQVCAGYLDHSTCQGDSGGPLQCRDSSGAYVLSGVTSYGDKACGGQKPAVFTNIEKFVPWINKVRADYP